MATNNLYDKSNVFCAIDLNGQTFSNFFYPQCSLNSYFLRAFKYNLDANITDEYLCRQKLKSQNTENLIGNSIIKWQNQITKHIKNDTYWQGLCHVFGTS